MKKSKDRGTQDDANEGEEKGVLVEAQGREEEGRQ